MTVRGWGLRDGEETNFEGHREHQGDRSVLYLDYCGGYVTIHTFVKTHQTVYLKHVNFTICKLYLDTAGSFAIVCVFFKPDFFFMVTLINKI